MDNIWIVVPHIQDFDGMPEIIENLTGGFVAPETFETREFNEESGQMELVDAPHPYFGEPALNFSNRVIVINVDGASTDFQKVVNLSDENEDINIFRSINTGIDYAIANGANAVLVIKEATSFDTFAIADTLAKLKESDKKVVCVNGFNMFMLDASCELRFDEQFRIWYGDNDFFVNIENFGGVDFIGARYSKFDILFDWASREDLKAITKEDEIKYQAKHG